MSSKPVGRSKGAAPTTSSIADPVGSRAQSLSSEPKETFAEVSNESSFLHIKRQPAESVEFVYCASLLHRMARSEADDMLAACFHALRPLGTLRVATLDLDRIVHGYLFDWTDLGDGLSRTGRLNAAIQRQDVKYIFGEEELTTALIRAGFVEIQRFCAGASSHRRFWSLERDPDQTLILEAKKPVLSG